MEGDILSATSIIHDLVQLLQCPCLSASPVNDGRSEGWFWAVMSYYTAELTVLSWHSIVMFLCMFYYLMAESQL